MGISLGVDIFKNFLPKLRVRKYMPGVRTSYLFIIIILVFTRPMKVNGKWTAARHIPYTPCHGLYERVGASTANT